VNLISLVAPVFLLFEIWQLVMCERYVGIKQIAREPVACLWSSCIILYGLWMIALLATPNLRVYGLSLIATTAVGYSIRRNCGLKLILVVLTFEGAIRVGILSFFGVAAWSHV
jgi:hypothetical protein